MLWFLKTVWGTFPSVRSAAACPTSADFSLVLLLKTFQTRGCFWHLLLFDPHLFSAIVFHAGLCSVNHSNSWMVGFEKNEDKKKKSAKNSVFHCEEFKECHAKSAHLNRLIEKKRCYFLNQSLCIKNSADAILCSVPRNKSTWNHLFRRVASFSITNI